MTEQTVEQTYARAGFGGTLRRGTRPAVIVVDFSIAFTDPDSPFGADLASEVAATRRLLDVARDKRLLTVCTTVAYQDDMGDAGLSVQKYPAARELRHGSRLVELDPRLGVGEHELVITKKCPSALFGTNLAALLVSRRVDTCVVCGATTSGCVRATVVDLFQYGFPTLVPRECVGDRSRGPHEASLFDMGAKYADVVDVDDVARYLESVPAATA